MEENEKAKSVENEMNKEAPPKQEAEQEPPLAEMIGEEHADVEKEEDTKEVASDDKEEEKFDFTQLLPDRMDEILSLQIFQLREWAHIYMGLVPHPKQKKVVVDSGQAKLAIDTASAIVEILLPNLPQDQQREMKVLISDLKMNFISHASA